eukprot:11284505-Ditylum_brightwellii.AAC.1
MVKCLCLDTLDIYVFDPSKSQITEDLLLGLKRYMNLTRWKDVWHLKALKNKTTDLTKKEDIDAKQGDNFRDIPKNKRLGT